MIVGQVYIYAFYDRASHSYAGTCSFAEKIALDCLIMHNR